MNIKGLFPIVIAFLISGCDTVNDSPCILQATYDSAPSSSSFAFKKDGTFEWTNGGGLGGSTYEGRYLMQDSIIMLDKIGFDRVVKSTRLLITSKLPWAEENGSRYVIQINNRNNIVDSMFVFRIYLDKRDSL